MLVVCLVISFRIFLPPHFFINFLKRKRNFPFFFSCHRIFFIVAASQAFSTYLYIYNDIADFWMRHFMHTYKAMRSKHTRGKFYYISLFCLEKWKLELGKIPLSSIYFSLAKDFQFIFVPKNKQESLSISNYQNSCAIFERIIYNLSINNLTLKFRS